MSPGIADRLGSSVAEMTDNVAAGARTHSEPIDCRGVPLDGAAGITKSDLTFEEALMIRKAKAVLARHRARWQW
jgi:hypothetical protein